MTKYFLDSNTWKYSESLQRCYRDLQKEFHRVPKFFYQDNKEYKIATQGNWKFINFIRKGRINYFNLWLFPTVKKLLNEIPIFDNCMFSIVGPNSSIAAHAGHSDQHFRVHMAIETDGQAWIRVGNEQRYWHPQEILIFDDYANHEVCNPSTSDRVVFMFDIPRDQYYDNIKF